MSDLHIADFSLRKIISTEIMRRQDWARQNPTQRINAADEDVCSPADFAREIVHSLAEAGYAVVSVQPTKHQLISGLSKIRALGTTNQRMREMLAAWRAMIAAQSDDTKQAKRTGDDT